jgi:PAS domain S-box-containing protein
MRDVSRPHKPEPRGDVLDVLAASDSAALATDVGGRIVFWNRAAERLVGRPASQVLGRRCHDVISGRDIFGNRFCHENCAVLSMSRKGESVQGFEISVAIAPRQDQAVQVTVLRVPGARPESFTLVHILQPIDQAARLARALERLGARRATAAVAEAWPPLLAPRPVAVPKPPPLTEREAVILKWAAAGLQNKEVAQRLGISLATVRNHIHNILEKLGVHSKLEAVSLAFRQGWVVGSQGDSTEGR